jgi:hypothetical protein
MPITVSKELRGVRITFEPLTGEITELSVEVKLSVSPPGAAVGREMETIHYDALPELTLAQKTQAIAFFRTLRGIVKA